MSTAKQSTFHRFWRILNAEKQEVRSIYIYAFFQGVVNLSLPLGIQSIINFLQAGTLSTSWYVLVTFVLGGILLGGYLQLKQLTVLETIEQRLFANVSFHYALRIPKLSLQSSEGKYLPEVINRFFEVTTVQKGLSKLLLDFSAAIIQVLFGIILLSLYSPSFFLLGALVILIIYGIFHITGPAGMRTSMAESNYKFQVAHWLQEVGRTLNTFKLAGKTPLPLQRTDELTCNYLSARNQHFKILAKQYKALVFFKLAIAASLIILGSILVINKEINIGQFVAAEIVVLMLIASVEKIILNISVVYDVLTSLEKMDALTEIKTERDGGEDIPNEQGGRGYEVSLKNINLSFANSPHPVLNNVSLDIKSGEKLCITGSNASGKTALLKLMAGLYEHYDGNVTYNQIPLRNLKLDSFRLDVGENFTEQEIFKGTISENISCGRKDVDFAKIIDSAHKAKIDEFIQRLPLGYNTVLVPEGRNLPGSIKRKLILARCFAGSPRMYLIEDTLVSQSQEERNAFFDSFFAHAGPITTIIVSNDPEVAKRCDRTYKLINGNFSNI
jgi:ABC-type bacteriocin/lantibiotic exporter with double-glycine peptidase domain